MKENNMKLIKLTSIKGIKDLYVNPNHIGHFYRIPQEKKYSQVIAEHTRLGITTHNNGGFEIVETPEQIIKLITEKI